MPGGTEAPQSPLRARELQDCKAHKGFSNMGVWSSQSDSNAFVNTGGLGQSFAVPSLQMRQLKQKQSQKLVCIPQKENILGRQDKGPGWDLGTME